MLICTFADLYSSLELCFWTPTEEIEREMRKCHTPDGGDSVSGMRWRVQRSRQPMDLDLTPTLLHSDGTEHIVATCLKCRLPRVLSPFSGNEGLGGTHFSSDQSYCCRKVLQNCIVTE